MITKRCKIYLLEALTIEIAAKVGLLFPILIYFTERKSFPQYVDFFFGDFPILSEHVHVFFGTKNVSLDTLNAVLTTLLKNSQGLIFLGYDR